MDSSSNNSLAQRFARRAAEHLLRKYGYEEARERLLMRLDAAGANDRQMLADIVAALDARQRHQ